MAKSQSLDPGAYVWVNGATTHSTWSFENPSRFATSKATALSSPLPLLGSSTFHMESLVAPPENHGGDAGVSVPTGSCPPVTRVSWSVEHWSAAVVAPVVAPAVAPLVAPLVAAVVAAVVAPVVAAVVPLLVVGDVPPSLPHAAASTPKTARMTRTLRIELSSRPMCTTRPRPFGRGRPRERITALRAPRRRFRSPLGLPPEPPGGEDRPEHAPRRHHEEVVPLPRRHVEDFAEVRGEHRVGEVVDRKELRHDDVPG